MPGLFGYWNAETDPDVNSRSLSEMAACMQHHPDLKVEKKFYPGFGAGRVYHNFLQPHPQPAADGEGRFSMWFDGELYNAEKLKHIYNIRQTGHMDGDAALCLALFEKAGWDFLQDADGIFNIAIYDRQNHSLALANDRLGMRPLFWTETGNGFAYAGEVKSLLKLPGVRLQIDPLAVDEWFCFSVLTGNRTWIRGVEMFPAGTVMEISRSEVEKNNYWSFGDIAALRSDIKVSEAAEELGRLWKKSVAKRVNGRRTGQALSGGLDSRAVLAAVPESQADSYTTYTYGMTDCDDLDIAHLCSVLKKVKHHFFEINENNWLYPRSGSVWRTDGLGPILDLHTPEAAMKIKGLDITLGGHGAEILKGDGFIFKNSKIADFVSQITIENGFVPLERRVAAQKRYESLIEGLPGNNIWQTHYLLQTHRRFSATGPISVMHCREYRFPFADIELINFAASLPDSVLGRSHLFEAFLYRFFPEFFKTIPNNNTKLPVCSSKFQYRIRRLQRFQKRLFQSGCRKAGIKLKKNTSSYHNYPYWLRNSPGGSVVRSLLYDPEARYKDLTDNRYADYVIDAFFEKKNDNLLRNINTLLSFETYLRLLENPDDAGHMLEAIPVKGSDRFHITAGSA